MKRYILLLITFGLIILVFGCSSSKDVINEQNEIESEYTIVKDSISSSQLNKLLDSSVKKLVVTTEDTEIATQKVCDVNDSSITILTQQDFELYKKRVAKFHENYILGIIASDDYPVPEQPDTIIVPINSIQSISYYAEIPTEHPKYDDHEYSKDELQIFGGGIEIDVRKNELTLDAFYELRVGIYGPIFEYNTTFNNSENKLRISSSALYSLGYTFVGMLVGKAITGEPIDGGGKKKSGENPLWLIVYSPLLLTNAEHHLFILNPSNSETARSIGLSVFAGFRTDIFDTKWIVYSPGVGVQIEYNYGKKDYGSSNNSIDFQLGVEYPYDFRFNNFNEPKITAGIKVKYL